MDIAGRISMRALINALYAKRFIAALASPQARDRRVIRTVHWDTPPPTISGSMEKISFMKACLSFQRSFYAFLTTLFSSNDYWRGSAQETRAEYGNKSARGATVELVANDREKYFSVPEVFSISRCLKRQEPFLATQRTHFQATDCRPEPSRDRGFVPERV